MLYLPHLPEPTNEIKTQPSLKIMQNLEQNILYEDANIIILNKPAGIAAHGGSGISFGVIETMRANRPEIKNLELVHRLDRATSGCLILAKKHSALRELHEMLRLGKIKKKYLVLVRGQWQGGKRKVEVELVKNQLQSGERLVKVKSFGNDQYSKAKKALTVFQPEKIFKEASLLAVTLGTGRTHQIRVHAQALDHQVAGDEKYGDKIFNKLMHEKGLKRMFLHASSLTFKLSGSDKAIAIAAPLPIELQNLLLAL
jgi:23S rRNA pseudouridine955/2504/2580 synthase